MDEEDSMISVELFDSIQIEWKVVNFLSQMDFVVLSPPFSFVDATWELQIYPDGEESDGYIDLGIQRLNCESLQHYVFCKFYFKTESGYECESHFDSLLFESANQGWIITKYLQKSKLLAMKDCVVPNGVLTVICQMRAKRNGFHRCSTTESTTLQLVSENRAESKLSVQLKELLLKQEDCDVIIKVKGREFPAHRLILKARSPVFASKFHHDVEKLTRIIDIKDCDPSTFSSFLSFLYTGNVENLSAENVFSLFSIAAKYDVQDLRKKCLDFLKENLSLDTFCETIALAVQHSETHLVKFCTGFFAKNLQEIIVTAKWQKFLTENPTESNKLFIDALVPNKN